MKDIHNVTLAEHPGLGQVRLCGCNAVHLTIGPVTMTIAPEAFLQVATLVRNAMEELETISETRRVAQSFLRAEKPVHSRITH